MDSIANTTNAALITYFNNLRRLGKVSLSERYKLLVLVFLNYIRNHSDSIYQYTTDKTNTNVWTIDQELLQKIESVFYNNIRCLSDNTCSIQFLEGDCTRIIRHLPIVTVEPETVIELLALNETEPYDTSDNTNTTVPFYIALNQAIWNSGSGLIIENYENSNDTVYFKSNQ